ncbi:response regulator [Deinococcus sedimenti]|nr:response regulator [Deinococcus sedimenti]
MSGVRILMVTHDDQEAELIEVALAQAARPWQLARCTDSRALLPGLLSRHTLPPHLVLLEQNMPFLDGYDVLGQLRAQSALVDLPVVLLSNSSHESDLARAFSLGADEYLVKEQSFPALMGQLTACLLRWEARLGDSERGAGSVA